MYPKKDSKALPVISIWALTYITTNAERAVAAIILIVFFFELKWLFKKSGTVIES